MSKIEQSYIDLLLNPQAELEKVLENSNLAIAIRISSDELLDYLEIDNVINELCDWVLTIKNIDKPNHFKMMQSSLSLLTNNNKTLQNQLVKNRVYSGRLVEFTNQDVTESLLAGHFNQLMKLMIKTTGGSYLKLFPNISSFFIKNLNWFSIRDLLIFILSEHPKEYNTGIETLQEIARHSDNYSTASVLYRSLSANNDLYIHFKPNDIVETLLETGVKTENELAATEIFRTVYLIEQKQRHPELIQKYAQIYKFPNNLALPAAVRVFKVLTPEITLKLFDNPLNSFLNESIVEVFRIISKEEKIKLINDTDLFTKLYDNFQKVKSNGQLTRLAEYVSIVKGLPFPDNWSQFNKTVLNKHLLLMESQFGGEIEDSDAGGEEEEECDDDDCY